MRNLIRSAVLALGLLPGFAHAQNPSFPQTMPPNTVAGRLGISAGPVQAIPFINFVTNLPLASGKMFVGSLGNFATPQTPSGDCTISLSGVITCTQAAGNFLVIGNLTVGGSVIDGNGILATNIAAPAIPASGTTRIYVDSTTKIPTGKNDVGTLSNMVTPISCSAAQWISAIAANAAATCSAIPANAVTRAMQAQGIARSVVGVTGNATANVADIQGTANQFLGVNAAGTALAFNTLSQDCTLATGVITCTKTNNVAFAASATTDTTNGANISSGIIPAARISLPKLFVTLAANQSVTDGALTLINFATVQTDSLSAFNTSTHVYTPTVAGWYLVTVKLRCGVLTSVTACVADILRNGTAYGRTSVNPASGSVTGDAMTTALVNVNGSTDTISAQGLDAGTGGSNVFQGGSAPFITSMTVSYQGP